MKFVCSSRCPCRLYLSIHSRSVFNSSFISRFLILNWWLRVLWFSYVFIMLRATLVFSCLHSPSMFLICFRSSYCYSLWFLNYIGFEDLLRSVILHDSRVAWIVHRHLPCLEETKLPRHSEILSTVEVLKAKLPQRSHQQNEAAQ